MLLPTCISRAILVHEAYVHSMCFSCMRTMHFQARIEMLVFFVEISDIGGPNTISGIDYWLVGISWKFQQNLQNIGEILVQMRYISKKIECGATHNDNWREHKKLLIYLRFFQKKSSMISQRFFKTKKKKSLIFFKFFFFNLPNFKLFIFNISCILNLYYPIIFN